MGFRRGYDMGIEYDGIAYPTRHGLDESCFEDRGDAFYGVVVGNCN
jgi:hypothetical protein